VILIAVIGSRAAWMLFYNGALRVMTRVLADRAPQWIIVPPWKGSVLGAWCGMRGIVTLAAALALPDGADGGAAFPYRDLILLTAFGVVIGTLVVQGLTLRALAVALNLDADDNVEVETRHGRAQMLRAAIESLDGIDGDVARTVRAELSVSLEQLVDDAAVLRREIRHDEVTPRTSARTAARISLNQLRLTGVIGEESVQQLEAELDMIELEAEVTQPLVGRKLMNSNQVAGLVTIAGKHSVDATVDKLKAILQAKGVMLFALVDHSGEAEKAGLKMPPTKLLIFGSPKAGTPLMLKSPSIAIDLPLKILVAEDDQGKVWISWNSAEYLMERHALPKELLSVLAVVEGLAGKAAE